jgi:Erv1 / Alr family
MTALSAGKDVSDEKREAYVKFFESMPDILPCAQCGKHLRENLQTLPIDTTDLFRWSVDLHNLVNTQLNKPEVAHDKAYRYWSSRCSKASDRDRMIIGLGVFLLVVFVLYFMSRPRG